MIRTAIFSVFLLAFSALAADVSGEYVGTFSSNTSDSQGKIRTVIKKTDSAWECKLFYSMGESEVAAKSVSCSVEGNKVTSEYTADSDGGEIHITIEGTAGDDHGMEGTYKAVGGNGEVVDQGKWKASPNH
jgi:hypothetical protein